MYNFAFVLAATLPTVVVHAPHADLTLEVARTESQREYGLMNRTQLAPHNGMIFVFGGDGPVAFWMKNTLVPLDMVFVAADGTVRRVFANVAVVSPALPDDGHPARGRRREVRHRAACRRSGEATESRRA